MCNTTMRAGYLASCGGSVKIARGSCCAVRGEAMPASESARSMKRMLAPYVKARDCQSGPRRIGGMQRPNGMRLSCGAALERSQIKDYHRDRGAGSFRRLLGCSTPTAQEPENRKSPDER